MSAMPRYVPAAPSLLRGASWRRSSYSTGYNNCVETAGPLPGRLLAVRDSKNTAGPALLFRSASWSCFVEGLRAGLR
ncbi:DUF397 domain-containing protein [Streptomyces roseoverticillatus]|uniref:DUF397 domain-containing protein n=1 Tax=Streptomyces roseoverticillatus TaxID=66429 RepID=UPI001F1D44C3|nr:DUF397 domain-containing protein [Streptomyces roseoverticillatus]MCF3101526.1 DUF397 domain-containing protein [Streptomyces roseoverticillatus]